MWILGQSDHRALLVLGAFMPFGFALSSLSDSLRASALPIISGADEEGEADARATVWTLLMLAVGVFVVLYAIGALLIDSL